MNSIGNGTRAMLACLLQRVSTVMSLILLSLAHISPLDLSKRAISLTSTRYMHDTNTHTHSHDCLFRYPYHNAAAATAIYLDQPEIAAHFAIHQRIDATAVGH